MLTGLFVYIYRMIITLVVTWVFGFVLAYAMQRTEMAAESEDFTKGDRVLILALALLSFLWVLIMLIRGWVKTVGVNGYWQRPAKVKQLATTEKATD